MRGVSALLSLVMVSSLHAATWYVRPLSGEYGAEDGTSYATAFDGFPDIVWGAGGVQPGDTLYICDTWQYPTDFAAGTNVIRGSGTAGNPITIRGDYPNHPGVIIAARKYPTTAFTNLGNGSFRASGGAGNVWQGTPTKAPQLLKPVASAALVAATDGSSFSGSGYLYVHPYGGIMEDMYAISYSCLLLNGSDYLVIDGLRLFGGQGNDGVIRLCKSSASGATDITIRNCEIAFGSFTGVYAQGNDTSNILIEDSVIHDVPTATYSLGSVHSNWTMRRVEVYSGRDIRNSLGIGDRHALGGQNLRNWLVEDCYIHDWAGDGILDYVGSSAYTDNVTIRYNRIDNLNDADGANHHFGIARHGSNAANWAARTANWAIYGNIISNLATGAAGDTSGDGAAIRLKGAGGTSEQQPKIYNNTFYNCRIGLYWAEGGDWTGSGFDFRNNVSLLPKTGGYHVYLSNTGGSRAVTMGHNAWWPDTSGANNQFRWFGANAANLADFIARARANGVTVEAGSILADPKLTNAAGRDFTLQPGSPCINVGANLGTDYTYSLAPGSAWPDSVKTLNQSGAGAGWEIGAYVYPEGYTLTISAVNGTVTKTPNQTSYTYGQTVTLLATPNAGYTFTGWSGALTGTANPATLVMNANKSVTANFAAVPVSTYTLTISAVNGTVTKTPNQTSYTSGQTVTLQATPNTGYTFAGWSGALTGTANPATLVMNANKSVTANFTAVLYTLTVTAVNGTVTKTPNQTSYASGQTVTLQATPNAGYKFAGWSGALTGMTNPATLVMDANKSVTANFTTVLYTLTVTAVNGTVTKTPDQASYTYGQTVTLQAKPNKRYKFVGWSGDLAGRTNPATLVMNADKSVTANFTSRGVIKAHELTTPDISDTNAPVVTNSWPEPNAIQIPLNSLVRLHISDDGRGVDANTVAISVGNTVIYSGDVPSYRSAFGVCRRTGTPAHYTYAYQADQRFDFDQTIQVTVDASDLAGNVMPEHSYSFTTEMWAFGRNLKVSKGSDTLDKGKPATVCDRAGNIWAVWEAGVVGQRDVYVGKLAYGAEAFGDPVRLGTGLSDGCNPALAIDANDTVYVVWQDNRQGLWDIYLRTSKDGTTWSGEKRVTDSKGNHVHPAIVVDGQSPGRAYIAWQDDGAGHQDICVASSNDGFATMTVRQVTSDASDHTGPKLVVDPFNTVYLVWTDRRNGTDDIYGASSAAGPWTNVPLATGPGNQNSPAIATETAGPALHLVWVDDASGNQDIYYACAKDFSAGPFVGVNVADDALAVPQTAPTISTVGTTEDGLKVFVCWRDERNITANGGDADLYFAEVETPAAANVWIHDEGTGSDQSEPVLGIDSLGHPYLVWTDDRNTTKDIYYCGSTYVGPDMLASAFVAISAGGTVGQASVSGLNDVSVVIPAQACPQDVTVTIAPIWNLQPSSPAGAGAGSSSVVLYDFGPSGLEFNLPVTITVPYAVGEFGGHPPVPCWYDAQTGTVSQQGITDIETLSISPLLQAVRFRTTHFTPYVLLAVPPVPQATEGGSGVGGGGGCSLSLQSEEAPAEYFVPFALLAAVMGVIRWRDGTQRSVPARQEPRRT